MRSYPLFIVSFFISLTLHADLIGFPDDLISGKGETKLELGINYGNGTFYNCSDLVSCTRSNVDSLTWTPGIRYGLNSKTELYSRASWYSSRSHDTNILSLEESRSEHDRFSDLWIGINHRIWNDATTPGLLVFLESAAMENVSFGSHSDWVHGKTWVVGSTLYRSIDPIILSATASYRYSTARDVPDLDGMSIDPGDSFLVNPSISFAANNEVSITSGFQWQRQNGIKSDIYNGHSSTRTDLTLGMGYMWSDALTFHVSTSTDMTGDGGSSISMLALYTLGKEMKRSGSASATPSQEVRNESNTTKATTPPLPPIISNPPKPTPPIIPMSYVYEGKTLYLECTKVAIGWEKEVLKCSSIDANQTAIQSRQPLSMPEELAQASKWIQTQNPTHYTLEISIDSLQNSTKLLDDLAKTRFSYAHQPSFLHRLSKKRGAVALGVFATRSEALDYLNTLPFVTNKNNSLLRTFGGLTKELHSLK